MSRTYNHNNKKSSWKASCKKTTNRRIRYSAVTELTGVDSNTIWKMEKEVIKNLSSFTSAEAQDLFSWIDLHVEEEISVVPSVTKHRFWMD